MYNQDVLDLYPRASVGATVVVTSGSVRLGSRGGGIARCGQAAAEGNAAIRSTPWALLEALQALAVGRGAAKTSNR